MALGPRRSPNGISDPSALRAAQGEWQGTRHLPVLEEVALMFHHGPKRVEARWPAALTVILLLAMLAVVPGRLRLLPSWVPVLMGAIVLAPMLAAGLSRLKRSRAEHAAMLIFFVVAAPALLATLGKLVVGVVTGDSGLGGIELLISSSALWVANVLISALVFWHVDRNGPDARASENPPLPDWLFPQYSLPPEQAPAGWRPIFIDYLYLALSTATAFSTTDVAPLTARAKRLMMFELSISLVTLVIVGARAINILGS